MTVDSECDPHFKSQQNASRPVNPPDPSHGGLPSASEYFALDTSSAGAIRLRFQLDQSKLDEHDGQCLSSQGGTGDLKIWVWRASGYTDPFRIRYTTGDLLCSRVPCTHGEVRKKLQDRDVFSLGIQRAPEGNQKFTSSRPARQGLFASRIGRPVKRFA
jgi:hypothetical protein